MVLFTDGAKYVADQAGAYWLLDEIAIGQLAPFIAAERFQVWRLAVNADQTGALTVSTPQSPCDDASAGGAGFGGI